MERIYKSFEERLVEYIPKEFIPLCYELWDKEPFRLKITNARKTKAGDYRYGAGRTFDTITINHNLNPYAFLITYLHEVAHLYTRVEYGTKVAPHGEEWKQVFKQLLIRALNINKLPADIASALANYAKRPKASSYSDPLLAMALSKYDHGASGKFLLTLDPGNIFTFRGIDYKLIKTRRTKVLCERLDNNRKYLIPGHARTDE